MSELTTDRAARADAAAAGCHVEETLAECLPDGSGFRTVRRVTRFRLDSRHGPASEIHEAAGEALRDLLGG